MSSLVITSLNNILTQGLYLSSPPILTNGQTTDLLVDNLGNLNVHIQEPLGQALSAASIPVVIASDQSNVGVNVAKVGGAAVALGQTTMSASVPVVMANNQSPVPANISQIGGAALAFGQALKAVSIPVVLPSDQTVPVSGTVTATPTFTTIKNQMDTPVLDTSVTTINGSAGAFVQVVASLGNACTRIRVADTTGNRIGVYTGTSGSEALAFIVPAGTDDYYDFAIAASTRVSLRNMGATSITVGTLVLQFGS